MKKSKKIISVFALEIIILSLFFLIINIQLTPEEDSRNYVSDFEISVCDISSSGMQINISNKGNRFFSFEGDVYTIQKYKRNRWIDLIDERTERTSLCDDIGLYPDRDYNFFLKWEWRYGKLENGKYRILFPIYDSSDTYWITKELTIAENN